MTQATDFGLNAANNHHRIEGLNNLLSHFQVFYQNMRGLHWNIKGKHFFELHLRFETLYTDAQLKIDEVAERILTLGGRPYHTFEAYLGHNTLRIGQDLSEATQGVELVVENLLALINLERPLLQAAANEGDEGSVDMLTRFIAEQEKTVWMFKAWLS